MTRNILLVGISTLAFAASAASAQTAQQTDTTNPATGNRRVISCPDSNSCTVTQTGATTSFGSVSVVSGTNNTSSVTQTGDTQAARNVTTGSYNNAAQVQNGSGNSGAIQQTGTGDSTAGTGQRSNAATITQGSSNNVATIAQVRTGGANNSNGFNTSTITQGNANAAAGGANAGSNNSANATQNGTNLNSTITQDDSFNNNSATPGMGNATIAAGAATGVTADFNSATVNQSGLGSSSTVNQARRGNVAVVNMFGGGVNQTGSATAANNAQPMNVSTVRQTNTQFSLTNPDTNSTAVTAAAPNANNDPRTGNTVDVAIAGQQNISLIAQDGVRNTAQQSMLNGGPGNTSDTTASGTNPGTGGARPDNRSQGNSSTIRQSGLGNFAATSIGGRVTTGGGSGNVSSITQTQGNATLTAATGTGTMNATTAHRALVYQRGILDSTTITQTNNNMGGVNGANGTGTVQSGSAADVSQLSYNGQVTVDQTGSNNALVTQGSRTETTGADGIISITQVDAGDTTTTAGGSSGGQFGGGTGGTQTTTDQRNMVAVAQYGISNSMTVNQNAVNASATITQNVGSRLNIARVQQGNGGNTTFGANDDTTNTNNRGANANNLVATVDQSGEAGIGAQVANTRDTRVMGGAMGNTALTRGVDISQQGQNLYASATQTGGTASAGSINNGNSQSNNAIAISQVNSFSSATVSQNGTSLSAAVDQRSTLATPTLVSLVTVTQTGTNNGALARQTASAGASTSGAATAGMPGNSAFPYSRSGAQAAEIVILQSGSGNIASAEQRDRGQYARIDQTGGTNNTGRIVQDTGAINAVAILTQSGTNNNLTINQNAPGQYVNVSQTGMANAVTTTTQSSVTPGGTGGTVTTG